MCQVSASTRISRSGPTCINAFWPRNPSVCSTVTSRLSLRALRSQIFSCERRRRQVTGFEGLANKLRVAGPEGFGERCKEKTGSPFSTFRFRGQRGEGIIKNRTWFRYADSLFQRHKHLIMSARVTQTGPMWANVCLSAVEKIGASGALARTVWRSETFRNQRAKSSDVFNVVRHFHDLHDAAP